MIGIIVTGHGHFATGLTSSLTLIAGTPQHYAAVDFPQEYSVEQLETELSKAMDSLSMCDGILVMSDLAGGSPFKSAVICAQTRSNVEVLAGTNLPMLIEIGMARQFITNLSDLADMALQTGKDQVVKYEARVNEITDEDDFSDGI